MMLLMLMFLLLMLLLLLMLMVLLLVMMMLLGAASGAGCARGSVRIPSAIIPHRLLRPLPTAGEPLQRHHRPPAARPLRGPSKRRQGAVNKFIIPIHLYMQLLLL